MGQNLAKVEPGPCIASRNANIFEMLSAIFASLKLKVKTQKKATQSHTTHEFKPFLCGTRASLSPNLFSKDENAYLLILRDFH